MFTWTHESGPEWHLDRFTRFWHPLVVTSQLWMDSSDVDFI